MALPLLNNAESQASGTTVTTGNSGGTDATAFDVVTLPAGMTLTYDSGVTAAHGTNAFKLALTSTATAATYVEWTSTSWGAADAHIYGAFYFRTNVASIASSIRLVQFRSGATVLGYIGRNNGTSGFHFRTAADAQAGTISAAVSADTWYRVEFDVIPGGTSNLNVYVGDSASVQGTAASLAGTIGGTVVDGIRLGFNTANFSSTSGDYVLLDDLNVNDTALPGPGPYSAGAAPAVEPVFFWPQSRSPNRVARPGGGPCALVEKRYAEETAASGPASFVVTATDSLTFAESTAQTLAVAKTAADTMAFGEALTRTSTRSSAATDSVTFVESNAAAAGKTRTVTDAFSFAESLARTALALTRNSTDSLTLAESSARTASKSRTAVDTITFSEALLSGRSITRTVTDSATFSEALLRAALSFSRTRTDGLTFSEALTRLLTSARSTVDSVTLSETLLSGRSISRAVTDSTTFAETVTRVAGHPRSIADTITFAESLARVLGLTARQVLDAIHLAEAITSGKAVSRSVTDSFNLADVATKSGIGRNRQITDQFTFAEVTSRGTLVFARTATDAIHLAELVDYIATGAIVPVGILEGTETTSILEGSDGTTVLDGSGSVLVLEGTANSAVIEGATTLVIVE